MQCRIIATGEIKHFANNDSTAQTLIQAGVLEHIQSDPGEWERTGNGAVLPKMEPTPEPQWSIGLLTQSGLRQPVPGITYRWLGQYQSWTGEPRGVETGEAFGKRPVPEEISAAYEKQYKEFWTAERKAAIARELAAARERQRSGA